MSYFSDRELGEQTRDVNEIGETPWGGIQALICSRINDGSFGATYPEPCPDGLGTTGTNEYNLWQAMHAEIPNLPEEPWRAKTDEPSKTVDILDMIEFCWRCIGQPTSLDYHPFFKHSHLKFNVEAGQEKFCEAVNRIFSRNGIAYTLTDEGRIERLAPTVLREELASAHFHTGDPELDRMLEKARHKFLNHHREIRREALDTLWDAWERLKTLGEGLGKKAQVSDLLDATAGSLPSKYRDALEREAKELTWIGNNFQIRHSETNQQKIDKSEHIDYLFHRLFSLIQLIVRTRDSS